MCTQTIHNQYKELLESFADLNQMKQIVNQAFQREFEALEQYNHLDESNDIINREAFGFDNPFTGKLEKYAFRNTTLEDMKRLTYWHKNSQYCWLLMSAYEKFEDFIKPAYEELTGKKPRDLNTILANLSNTFLSIKNAESKNYFNINLRIAVLLVERMRHAITHDQGSIIDPPKFIKKIISDSGIGNNRNEHEEFVSQFIFKNKIFILELPIDNNSRKSRTHDLYRILISYLISYAYLVSNATE